VSRRRGEPGVSWHSYAAEATVTNALLSLAHTRSYEGRLARLLTHSFGAADLSRSQST